MLRLCYFYLHRINTWATTDDPKASTAVPRLQSTGSVPTGLSMPRAASGSMPVRAATALSDVPARSGSAEARARWARKLQDFASAMSTMLPVQSEAGKPKSATKDTRPLAAMVENLVLNTDMTPELICNALAGQAMRCESRTAGLSMLAKIMQREGVSSVSGIMLQTAIGTNSWQTPLPKHFHSASGVEVDCVAAPITSKAALRSARNELLKHGRDSFAAVLGSTEPANLTAFTCVVTALSEPTFIDELLGVLLTSMPQGFPDKPDATDKVDDKDAAPVEASPQAQCSAEVLMLLALQPVESLTLSQQALLLKLFEKHYYYYHYYLSQQALLLKLFEKLAAMEPSSEVSSLLEALLSVLILLSKSKAMMLSDEWLPPLVKTLSTTKHCWEVDKQHHITEIGIPSRQLGLGVGPSYPWVKPSLTIN